VNQRLACRRGQPRQSEYTRYFGAALIRSGRSGAGRGSASLRAVIPLVAGIMHMSRRRFWFANIASAIVWAPMLLIAGDAVGDIGDRLIGSANTVLLVFAGLTLLGIVGVIWGIGRPARPKPPASLKKDRF
jgi:hypothetical protein